MTKKQYKQELQRIIDQFERQKMDLAKTFALANNTVNIGDVIEDHTSRIKVDKIMYVLRSFDEDLPCCVYEGYQLTIKGNIRKDKSTAIIYQTNIIQ